MSLCDWSSDVCSSDLIREKARFAEYDPDRLMGEILRLKEKVQRLWHINIPAVNPVSPGNMICQWRGCETVWKTILGCAHARGYKEEWNERKGT